MFFGDLITLFVSLWYALFLRYLTFPSKEVIIKHMVPFSILILAWCIVFLIVGLYENHILVLKRNLPEIIINTQILNCALAAIFFYFIPYLSVAPKTVLFIYLGVSLVFIFIWRLFIFPKITSSFVQNAVVIGDGPDVDELINEIGMNPSYGILIAKYISGKENNNPDISFPESTSMVITDFSKEGVRNIIPKMYSMLFSGVQFVKVQDLYESMLGRVPMSLLDHNWFIENVSNTPKIAYRIFKRIIDLCSSIIIGVFLFVIYPFVFFAIKTEDKGKIFVVQERIGQRGKIFKLRKFRSMKVDDAGVWIEDDDTRHTKVGKFLRKTRIDELPQVWNLFTGDISLIGPRPDIKKLGEELSLEIPYYQIRNIVKPGLSGWAQITQNLPPQSLEDTKIRLSYDLYYIKHRSILLDLKIAIRTIKTLLSRSGS